MWFLRWVGMEQGRKYSWRVLTACPPLWCFSLSDSGFSSQGLETYVEMRPVSSSSSSAASDSAQVRGESKARFCDFVIAFFWPSCLV